MTELTTVGSRGRGRHRRRRPAVRRLLVLLVVVLLAPVLYSYVSTMTQPSSLPLGIRSIEWLRDHHGAWFVNAVERFYYTHTAPKPGGPALKAVPQVGHNVAAAAAALTVAGAHATKAAPAAKPVAYRPPAIRPLIRPALPGEGVWRAVGPTVDHRPPVLVTTFRSDPNYPRTVAYVAWIDHSLTQLGLYPGRYEPPSSVFGRGPMEVPHSQRWRLLATFNSGFAYKDGHGGFAVDGKTYTPFVSGMATVAAYRDGHVNVVSWNGGPTPGRSIVAARQNLPLIVNHGKPNPNLSNGPAWGATLGNAIRVWRSGLGIDRHGNLIYAAADYQTVGSLAAILIHAGAVRAMELDINAEWPTFVAYGHPGAADPLKLVPNSMQPAGRYLVPDDRDFFAVYRATGNPLVPMR